MPYYEMLKVTELDTCSDLDSAEESPLHGLPQSQQRSRFRILKWILHTILFSCNILLFVWISSREPAQNCHSRDTFHTPSLDAIEYRQDNWNLSLGSVTPYTAPPGPEVDALWDQITANPHGNVDGLYIPKKDLPRIRKTSVTSPDGGSYLAVMNVFHQLHCLNHLRKTVHKEYYESELKRIPSDVGEAHTAHCLDSLRLSLQCNADTSVITFDWISDYPLPWPNFASEHKCRNWDKLQTWSHIEYAKVKLDTKAVKHPIHEFATRPSAYSVPLRVEDVHYLNSVGEEVDSGNL